MSLPLLALLLVAAPPSFEERIREALAAMQTNHFATAQSSLEQATKLMPESAAAWFLLAQAHARQNNPIAALPAARRASQFAGKDPTLLYNLAVFFREAAQPDESIALAKRALAVENSAEVHSLLGQSYAARKDWPNAVAEFKEAVRRAPASEEPVFQLAQAYLQTQDFTSAAAILEQGRKTFDRSAQIELALGVAYYGQRRFQDAVGCYLRVMEFSPDTPQPYYFLGRILEHARDRLPAIIDHAVAFEKRRPGSPLGYVLHAKAIFLLLPASGFPEEAAQAAALLETALSIEEKQAEAHYLLGALLDRKQEYAGAAAHLERSVALNGKDPAPHFRLARIYERMGRKEAAAAERLIHERLSEQEAK